MNEYVNSMSEGARRSPRMSPIRRNRRAYFLHAFAAMLASLAALLAPSVTTAETRISLETGTWLLMVEAPACPYCRRWQAEIGGAYPASEEGRVAPLVRLPMRDARLARLAPVMFSPTFILLKEGSEIGRITGYPGPEFFWQLLTDLLRKAGHAPRGAFRQEMREWMLPEWLERS